jgi:hypothetical protein
MSFWFRPVHSEKNPSEVLTEIYIYLLSHSTDFDETTLDGKNDCYHVYIHVFTVRDVLFKKPNGRLCASFMVEFDETLNMLVVLYDNCHI